MTTASSSSAMIVYSEVTFDLEGFCEISRLTWECSGVKSVRVWCVDIAVWLHTTHGTTKTVRPVIFYRRVWGLSGLENRPTILKSSRVNQALLANENGEVEHRREER